jgi:hypothetical protein
VRFFPSIASFPRPFWELVGLSSCLLIGHWYQKESATDAAKKAFITCCKGAMKPVRKVIRHEEIEKRRRLVGVLDRNPHSG